MGYKVEDCLRKSLEELTVMSGVITPTFILTCALPALHYQGQKGNLPLFTLFPLDTTVPALFVPRQAIGQGVLLSSVLCAFISFKASSLRRQKKKKKRKVIVAYSKKWSKAGRILSGHVQRHRQKKNHAGSEALEQFFGSLRDQPIYLRNGLRLWNDTF